MRTPEIPMLVDWETQSELPIQNPCYTSDPSTQGLCLSWGLKGTYARLWSRGEECPQEIIDHAKAGGMFGASNARFDREIWGFTGLEDAGFPETKQEQFLNFS